MVDEDHNTVFDAPVREMPQHVRDDDLEIARNIARSFGGELKSFDEFKQEFGEIIPGLNEFDSDDYTAE